ncbi:MAG: ribonuclease H-like domain-containing protein [Nitrososphaerales archaeon]
MGRKDTDKLKHIAKFWKRKSKDTEEYEIVREPPKTRESFILSFVIDEEYQKAMQFKEQLIKEYRGVPLREAIRGSLIKNSKGNCYEITNSASVGLKIPDRTSSEIAVLSRLSLVYGIGTVKENRLKQEGYKTIEDLIAHPRWSHGAKELLDVVKSNNLNSCLAWLQRKLPKSHPLVYGLSSLTSEQDFLILDIETMGLFGRPIVLFGLGIPNGNSLEVRQYLLRKIDDEPGALSQFSSNFDGGRAIISFNGRAFDMPYIEERINYYGLNKSFDNPHFDLLHFSRRAWKEKLPNCQLNTIEHHIGLKRKVDIPSALVPEFYDTYLRTKNVGPLIPIVEHNRQDIVTLASIFNELGKVWEKYDE